MNDTVLMFPGQGSQYVGMLGRLGVLQPDQEKLLSVADEVLGFSIKSLIESGPLETLTATSNAQPALVAVERVYGLELERRGVKGSIALGHSLGEYSALVYAEVLRFEDALKIVRRRGELMERAVRDMPGKMAAIIGGSTELVDDIVRECRDSGLIEVVNFNSPQQKVLSGETIAIDHAIALVNESKKAKAVELNVSAPFHSSMMKPIAEEFGQFIGGFEMKEPRVIFIDNVTGTPESNPEVIRKKLIEQLYSPVLWEKSIITASSLGGSEFIECGPGSVLTGLMKRMGIKVGYRSVESMVQ